MCARVCAGPVWSRAPRNLRAVASATRRAVLQSPPPNRLGTGGGARGHRHSSDRSSGRAGEGAGAAAGWGAALVAAPLCGMIAKAQLDPDVREWLARHGAPLSHAACEAAAEPVAGARAPVQTPSEAAAEQALRAEVHEQLLSELERVRAERDALDEQRKELQAALAESAKRPATVVQQEVKYKESLYTYIHTYILTYIKIHAYMYSTYVCVYICNTHTHNHTRTHTHTHTHTQTHTHIYSIYI